MYVPAVDRPNGTAVIVLPGGGHERLSMRREGEQYAAWLGTLGVTSFVLKYRMREFGHPAPLHKTAADAHGAAAGTRQIIGAPGRVGIRVKNW